MNQCYSYDFRYTANDLTFQDIISCITGVAKKYTFQLEKGDSGYIHYQGRLSLFKKRRKMEALKLFSVAPEYFEPTVSTEYVTGESFYQLKEDTKIDGPWTDKDKVLYIPRQIREIKSLYPFQQTIVTSLTNWDTRSINYVYDPFGNNGKSILIGWIRAYGLGRVLPPMNDCKDMMRMVCDMPTSRAYIVDMPRCMNKDKLFGFYSAIEMIKDGYAYDDRYAFKEKTFDSPNIWIFGNTQPDTNLLSLDRWKVFHIKDDKTLVQDEYYGIFTPTFNVANHPESYMDRQLNTM